MLIKSKIVANKNLFMSMVLLVQKYKIFSEKDILRSQRCLWHLSRKESFFVFDMFRKLSFKPVHGGT